MKKYLFIFLVLLTPSLALAQDQDIGYYHMMDWHGWGSWTMFIYPLIWIIVLGGLIYLAVKAFLQNEDRQTKEGPKSALEILKERYAKGEINKKEFEEMKKDIEK